MTVSAELTAEQELEAKVFAAKKLENPDRAVRVDWEQAWSDGGNDALAQVDAKLRATLDRLGLAEVEAGTVKEFKAYPNTLQELPKGGRIRFPDVFHNLADANIWADNPNDFIYTIRLPYSEELDAVIEFTSEEAGIICGDCSALDAETEKILPGESCEHHRGEYDIRHEYHVLLVKPEHEFSPGCYGHTHFP